MATSREEQEAMDDLDELSGGTSGWGAPYAARATDGNQKPWMEDWARDHFNTSTQYSGAED